MPVPRRKVFQSLNSGALTLDQIDQLLKKELGAVRISAYDKVEPQQWAKPTKESEMNAMGLFDHLIEKGLDPEEIPLDPFKIDDGDYHARFVSAELREPAQEGWSFTLELVWQVDGGKFNGKPIRDQRRIPTDEQFEEDPERSKLEISSAFQRLASLGLTQEEIPKLDCAEINTRFQGDEYLITLYTPTKNNDDKRQWVRKVVAIDGNDSASSLLDE